MELETVIKCNNKNSSIIIHMSILKQYFVKHLDSIINIINSSFRIRIVFDKLKISKIVRIKKVTQ